MKYFVNYKVNEDKKVLTPEGIMDINTDVELTAGDVKTKMKEWFAFPDSKVIASEELKLNNKVLEDTDVISSKKSGLKYTLNFSGSTN